MPPRGRGLDHEASIGPVRKLEGTLWSGNRVPPNTSPLLNIGDAIGIGLIGRGAYCCARLDRRLGDTFSGITSSSSRSARLPMTLEIASTPLSCSSMCFGATLDGRWIGVGRLIGSNPPDGARLWLLNGTGSTLFANGDAGGPIGTPGGSRVGMSMKGRDGAPIGICIPDGLLTGRGWPTGWANPRKDGDGAPKGLGGKPGMLGVSDGR